MDIFGIGILELVFILIIAMIVVGPRDLGKVGRQVGRFLNRMYKSESWRMLNEASRTLRNLPNRLAREAALDELDSVRDSIKDAGRMIKGEMQGLDESLQAWTPSPTSPVKHPDEKSPEKPKGTTKDSEEGKS
jgi:sec-independent protein translocase protein TatB